jgi:hypothetical protein
VTLSNAARHTSLSWLVLPLGRVPAVKNLEPGASEPWSRSLLAEAVSLYESMGVSGFARRTSSRLARNESASSTRRSIFCGEGRD